MQASKVKGKTRTSIDRRATQSFCATVRFQEDLLLYSLATRHSWRCRGPIRKTKFKSSLRTNYSRARGWRSASQSRRTRTIVWLILWRLRDSTTLSLGKAHCLGICSGRLWSDLRNWGTWTSAKGLTTSQVLGASAQSQTCGATASDSAANKAKTSTSVQRRTSCQTTTNAGWTTARCQTTSTCTFSNRHRPRVEKE